MQIYRLNIKMRDTAILKETNTWKYISNCLPIHCQQHALDIEHTCQSVEQTDEDGADTLIPALSLKFSRVRYMDWWPHEVYVLEAGWPARNVRVSTCVELNLWSYKIIKPLGLFKIEQRISPANICTRSHLNNKNAFWIHWMALYEQIWWFKWFYDADIFNIHIYAIENAIEAF